MGVLEAAKEVLRKNFRNGYTVPSRTLYPHQWSWDSAFAATGYANYDEGKAIMELESLFEGQWKNGMVPHIVFREKSGYFPGPEYWEVSVSPNSPGIETSGITQPPVHATASLHVYEMAKDKDKALAFLERIYPKLLMFHRFLLTERDPERSGAVTILHPWESGFDNSPRWDEAISRIKPPAGLRYRRTDTKQVSKAQRPGRSHYDAFVYLVDLMKKNRYDAEKSCRESPFKVKDLVFTTLLYLANESLLRIAEIVGKEGSEIEGWLGRTRRGFIKTFCPKPEEGLLYDYDLVSGRHLMKRTVASLIPIATDILGKENVSMLVAWMQHAHFCQSGCVHNHRVPTTIAVEEKDYSPLNYWRGPVWINTAWLLWKGLLRHSLIDKAETLRRAVIELVREHGFWEYYDPRSGEGLGARDFSWSAALVIDMTSKPRGV